MLEKIIEKLVFNIKITQLKTEFSKHPIIFNQTKNNYETIIIEEIAKQMGIPFINESIHKYTQTGYIGPHLTEILIKLLNNANGDIKLAQKGVVLLNDISVLYELNASGISTILFKELPELITGHCYEFLYNGKKIKFDTTNVTFIGSGNFSKISEEQMKACFSINQEYKYIGGFQEIIDINNITFIKNDIIELINKNKNKK